MWQWFVSNKIKAVIFVRKHWLDTFVVRIKYLSNICSCDLSKWSLAVWVISISPAPHPFLSLTHQVAAASDWCTLHQVSMMCIAGVFLVLVWELHCCTSALPLITMKLQVLSVSICVSTILVSCCKKDSYLN